MQLLKTTSMNGQFQLTKIAINMLLATFVTVGGGMLLPNHGYAMTATTDFSTLVEQVTPAIVRINVTKKISEEEIQQVKTAEVLRQYFGHQLQIPNVPPSVMESNYGTGFFVSEDGFLLTNHHVVAGAEKITITLNDRQELDAKLIGSDERTDMAVLKVEGKGFPALPLGDSDRLKVGEPVLAIGSPFGFDYSASAGIVSAKSRNFSKDTSVPFIQTDVALNPGNSGGPLFNRQGEVIGINSRIFTGTGGYMGLSFSIPIDVAMEIYQQIRQHGKVFRGYLGILPQDIDRNLAEAYGLEKPQGALITRVSPDTPAEKAGLKAGDLVLAYNQQNVITAGNLLNMISRSKPKDRFELIVKRNQQILTLTGQLEKAPQDVSSENDKNTKTIRLGLRIRELKLDEQREIQGKGMLITAVDPFGLAAISGLRAGDVIVQVNQQPIQNVQDFAKAVHSLPVQGVVTIQLIRQGVPMILGMRIE